MITTVDIDKPPAEVYAYLTDPARFPHTAVAERPGIPPGCRAYGLLYVARHAR
jgi:hypothetical protein